MMVIVHFSLSVSTMILKSVSSHKKVVSVKDLRRALSIASDAFDINSLKNISLFE
jgi:hypothetical protein